MSSLPTVMIMQPHLGRLGMALGSAYRVLNHWEAPSEAELAEVQAMVVAGEFPLDKALIERLPRLGLIACFTAGYDGIDVAWTKARGLKASHAPGVNHEDVADHAIGLITGHIRHIVAGDRELRAGQWHAGAKTLTPSLAGKRVGLVGLGGIGEAVARRCEPMRMSIAWWGPRAKPGAAWPRAESLEALARDSDILVVACKVDETNRGMISKAVIEALGPDGLLVNVSRGQVIDEDALIAALKDGRLGGAALDVFVQEPTPAERWADVPNTTLTPHTAGATFASVQKMVELMLANLAAFFAGEPLKTPIED
jgi:lactate dehydrogenase-like 2-hydroxyacid dehydrogenase